MVEVGLLDVVLLLLDRQLTSQVVRPQKVVLLLLLLLLLLLALVQIQGVAGRPGRHCRRAAADGPCQPLLQRRRVRPRLLLLLLLLLLLSLLLRALPPLPTEL